MHHSVARSPCLVLNASYEAINICGAKRGLTLLMLGKAKMEVDGDREVRPGVMIPSVIRLVEYKRIPVQLHALSRKGIFIRDRFTCQYCGEVLNGDALTLDHVIPESRGGRKSWENLVTCCKPCNRKKADQLLSECDMVLLRKPRPMTVHTARFLIRSMGEEKQAWRKYLYYDA